MDNIAVAFDREGTVVAFSTKIPKESPSAVGADACTTVKIMPIGEWEQLMS